MSSNGGSITLRVALAGAPEVRAALASLGPAGAKALKQIEAAAHGPTAGMLAINAVGKDVSKGLEETAKGAGMLSGGLMALGPAGLAAAVGIGAAIEAGKSLAEATRGAMEYGEALETAAAAAGVSTTTLQVYRHAVQQTGGSIEDADKALRGFTTAFGMALEGSKRQLNFFEKLGIGPDQLKQFKTVDEALDAVVGHVQGLGNAAEQAAFAKRLGMESILPVLQQTQGRMAELKGEAMSLGIVMDEHTVKTLAEAEKKFKSASEVINIQFKSALVDIAPFLVDLITHIADLVKGLDAFLDRFKDLKDKSATALASERAALVAKLSADASSTVHYDRTGKPLDPAYVAKQQALYAPSAPTPATVTVGRTGKPLDPAFIARQQAAYAPPQDQIKARIAEIDAINAARAKADAPTGPTLGTGHQGPTSEEIAAAARRAEAARQKALEEQKASQDAIAKAAALQLTAKKAELEVQLSSTRDATRRAAIQAQLVDLDAQAHRAALERDIADTNIEAAKGKISKAAAAQVVAADRATETAEAATAEEKKRQIALTAWQAMANDGLKLQGAERQAQIDMAQAQLALAKTTEQRKALALKIFDLEEAEAQAKLRAAAKDQTLSPTDRAAAQTELTARTDTAGMRRQLTGFENDNAWDKWKRQVIVDAADVQEALAKIKTDGMDALNQSLFDSQGRFTSLANVAHAALTRIIVDLEQMAIKEAEAAAFGGGGGGGGGGLGGLFSAAASMFGFGGGGSVASTASGLSSLGASLGGFAGGGRIKGPGGPTSDSILIAASDGEGIVKASAMQRYGHLIDAMNSDQPLRIPPFAGGGTVGGSGGGGVSLGGSIVHLTVQHNINANGADPAQLMRVEARLNDLARGEPERVGAYVLSLKKHRLI